MPTHSQPFSSIPMHCILVLLHTMCTILVLILACWLCCTLYYVLYLTLGAAFWHYMLHFDTMCSILTFVLACWLCYIWTLVQNLDICIVMLVVQQIGRIWNAGCATNLQNVQQTDTLVLACWSYRWFILTKCSTFWHKSQFPISDWQFQILNSELLIADSQFPIPSSQFPILSSKFQFPIPSMLVLLVACWSYYSILYIAIGCISWWS
jgi:hypothetical protein